MEALDVKYESRKKEESPYDPELGAKIKEGKEDYKAGRYKSIETGDLWK